MSLTWSELYSKIMMSAREKKSLVSASFELTSRCNLQCSMCYICQPASNQNIKHKELSAVQWVQLAKEARDIGLLYVTLTGGEVFLREDLKKIYEEFMKLGFVIQIYTNGTLINQEIVSWLKSLPPSKVSITLYGASRDTYEKVTGYAEGYDRTIRAIDYLLAAGVPTEIKTTVVKGNMYDFDQLSEFAYNRDLSLGIVNYVSPRREGSNSNPLGNRLSPHELCHYEVHMKEHNHKYINKFNASEDPLSDNDKLSSSEKSLDLNDAFQCSAGKCAAWVTWDGKLLPCGILDRPHIYPLLRGFNNAWEELKQQCSIISPSTQCYKCELYNFCDSCPARLLNETGSFIKPAPYLCEIARLRAASYEN